MCLLKDRLLGSTCKDPGSGWDLGKCKFNKPHFDAVVSLENTWMTISLYISHLNHLLYTPGLKLW